MKRLPGVALMCAALAAGCRGPSSFPATPTSPTTPAPAPDGACTYRLVPGPGLTPAPALLPRMGWTGMLEIVTQPDCQWTAVTESTWARVSPVAGRGPATVALEVAFNPQTSYAAKRTSSVAIGWPGTPATERFAITQSGSCNLIVRPATAGLAQGSSFVDTAGGSELTVSSDGGRFHLWVLTEPYSGCAWTAESADGWLSFDFPQLHDLMGGDGDLHFTVPANLAAADRRAAFVMDGRKLTVVQKGR